MRVLPQQTYSTMENLRKKAISLGATEFGRSNRKDKKYYVVYKGKKIHFGHTSYDDYTTHGDDKRRRNYLARARGIRSKHGELTYNNKNYANYWAIHINWK